MTAQRWGEIKAILATVLEAEPSARSAMVTELCASDAELRREVESLLALEARAEAVLDSIAVPGALFRSDAAAPAAPPTMIGAYRILREIGRGGMGVVYLGERADGEYRKQVAIKLITRGRHGLDRDMERRFRRERQILAQFEHPGIARMVDGGATAEGQPYFVMEYIEGLPLLEYSDAQNLSIRARIELFLSVCDAVAHAHQRLVVHRDLKPGNILISEEGRAKLLDFGLARVLHPELTGLTAAEDITQVGLPIMTPAYASPEQIRGAPYAVSDDVYSLGVILYELLTGKRPYHVPSDSLTEMVRVVCEQTPQPPSQAAAEDRVSRKLRGDLDNIASKALEKDPNRRYATVEELVSDLRRHLDGLPVRARPATFAYRAGKLLRRHRVAIPAGALAAILILTFAGATWWQARRAQRRFEEVRTLAHSMMFELHDAIAPLPGATAARNLLVARALEYLERLAKESAGDPKLAWEVAMGYERMAVVQGGASNSNLGDGQGAFESLRQSAAIMDRLAPANLSIPAFRHDYIRVLNYLAGAYAHRGNTQTAQQLGERCSELAETGYREHPGDAASVSDLLVVVTMRGDLLSEQAKYQEMVPLRQRALDLTVELSKLKASDAVQADLALAHKHLGALYGVLKRYPESHVEYQQAVVIDEMRCAGRPADGRARMDLSFDYSDLGWVLSRLGNDASALVAHRKALAIREGEARADPNDFRAARTVASSTERTAAVYRRLGDYKQAVAMGREGIALRGRLVDRSKSEWSVIADLADSHGELGDTYLAMKSKAEAVAEYEQARSLYSGLRDQKVLPAAMNRKINAYAAQIEEARK